MHGTTLKTLYHICMYFVTLKRTVKSVVLSHSLPGGLSVLCMVCQQMLPTPAIEYLWSAMTRGTHRYFPA